MAGCARSQTLEDAGRCSGPVRVTHRQGALFLALVITGISGLPVGLRADDSPARLPSATADQAVAASGSSLRLVSHESTDLPAPAPLVRQEPPSKPASNPTSASTSVATSATNRAAPQPAVSWAKWEGPAAVVPRGPDLQWKGAFHAGRPSSAAADAGVVPTSAELPVAPIRPVSLPNPPVKLGEGPDSPPAPPSAGTPPLPVQIAPSPAPGGGPSPTVEQHVIPSPSWEQQLVAPAEVPEKCISPQSLKSIRKITADISIKPQYLGGQVRLPPECSLGDERFAPRHWRHTTFTWTAASTCRNPLYFEDEQLERYGHSWGNVKQTAISAVKFFGTVPLLPYYMGVYPPNECIYDLGQYRPGSCAPYYLDPLPLSVRGALYEGTFLGLLPVAF